MRKGHFSGVKWKYASNNGHTQNKRYKILHAKHLIVQLVYNEPQAWKCKPKQTFGSLYFFVRGEGVKQLLKIFERSRSGAAVLAIEKKKKKQSSQVCEATQWHGSGTEKMWWPHINITQQCFIWSKCKEIPNLFWFTHSRPILCPRYRFCLSC